LLYQSQFVLLQEEIFHTAVAAFTTDTSQRKHGDVVGFHLRGQFLGSGQELFGTGQRSKRERRATVGEEAFLLVGHVLLVAVQQILIYRIARIAQAFYHRDRIISEARTAESHTGRNHVVRSSAVKGYLPDAGSHRQRILVIQQHDALGTYPAVHLRMGFEVGLVGIIVTGEGVALHHKLQHTLHAEVEERLIQRAVLHGFQNGVVLAFLPRLQHVITCRDGSHGIFSGIPVGHHQSLESPFIAEDIFGQFAVFAGVFAVHLVVGGHHAPGLSLLDGYLEAFQIKLAQGALRQSGVVVVAVGFLVVHGEVLQAGAGTFALDAVDVGSGYLAHQHGVFGIILVVSSAEGVTHQVDTGGEEHVHTVVFHFGTQSPAYMVSSIRIERSCHRGARGEFGGVIGAAVELSFGSHRQAVRSVGKESRWDAQAWNVVGTSGGTGELGVTAHRHAATDDEVHFLFKGQGADHFVDVVGTQHGRTGGGHRLCIHSQRHAKGEKGS